MISLFPSRQVAIEVFGFSVHWYGLLYLTAFLYGFWLVQRLQKYRHLQFSKDDWSNFLFYVVLGVLIGGRLGYVLFYQPQYFLQNPAQIFMVWKGGMASHGGFLGVTLLLLWVYRHRTFSGFALADVMVVPVAIGLALGRFGNFINYELYGTVTSLPWGMEIPGVAGLRHPTFFYAMAKNLFIAGFCYWHLRYKQPVVFGRTCAWFLMLYGVLRFLNEFFRVQDFALTELGPIVLTRGQLLSLPIIAIGMLMWWRCGKETR